MTDVPGSPGARVVESGAEARQARLGRPSTTGRGGMESKIGAAELAAGGGVPAWIASPDDLSELLAGRGAGTSFAAGDRGEPAFKLWLRHGKRMVGTVRVDEGAARAITAGNASLLAVGVTAVEGAFGVGDGVEIVDTAGRAIARGIAGVDSGGWQRPTGVEVVHRDRLVVFKRRASRAQAEPGLGGLAVGEAVLLAEGAPHIEAEGERDRRSSSSSPPATHGHGSRARRPRGSNAGGRGP